MIEVKKSFQHLSKEDLHQLLDLPVWLALYAAFHSDGKISAFERAEAIKLTYIRTYTAPKSVRELYRLVHHRFANRFDHLAKRLPLQVHDKLVYIRVQLKLSNDVLKKLDTDVEHSLRENLLSFYRHIFNADKSFFQYFTLPVFTGHMDMKFNSGKSVLSR